MMESDNSIEISGVVDRLMRGRSDRGAYTNDRANDRVTLVLGVSPDRVVFLDIPYKTENDFDLIPLELALKGARVSYKKNYKDWQEGIAEEWELRVTSGPLEGNSYKGQKV